MNEWLGCQQCSLYKQGGSIPSEGPTPADLFILGQSPGSKELETKKPFVGRSGQLLNSILRRVGLDRSHIHIGNAVKCYQPSGKTISVTTSRKCGNLFLRKEIEEVKPKVIICLGTVASRFFQEKILPGSYYFDLNFNTWVIFTHHPARVLISHSLELENEIVQAFEAAKVLLQETYTLEKPDVDTITTLQDLLSMKDQILQLPILAIDCETTGLNFCKDKILTVGLSDGDRCFGILFNDLTKDILKEILESSVPKIFFHGKFDCKFLKKAGIEVQNVVFDPLLAYKVLDPASPYSNLEALSLRYVHTTFEKNKIDYDKLFQRELTPDDYNMLLERGALDAYLTYHVYRHLKPQIDREFKSLYYDLVLPACETVMGMEYQGITIDKSELKQCETWLAAQLKCLKSEINQDSRVQEYLRKVGKTELNLNSPKQISELLYKHLKLSSSTTSTSKETLDQLNIELGQSEPLLNTILKYRNLAKLKLTYCKGIWDALAESDSDRIHPTFNLSGAITGRSSCSRPNLQTIPKIVDYASDIRKVFIAPKGYYLVETDYSQMELRTLAHYSKDSKLVKFYQEDKDVHRMLASLLFKISENQVTEEQRYLTKYLDFGIIYGRGATSIAQQFKLDIEEATRIKQQFLDLIPEAVEWMNRVQEFVLQNGYVKNMFGRKIPIQFDLQDEASVARARRLAVNYPIQGAASDITYLTAVLLRRGIKQRAIKGNLLLNIHDSLIAEIAEADLEKYRNLVLEVVNQIVQKISFRVPLKIDIKVGKNLANQKEFNEVVK